MKNDNYPTKIKFVGTGGVYDYELGNSAAIVQTEAGQVLIDCGYTVFPQLAKKNLLDGIDYLLLTHLHGDHAGSLHAAILHWKNIRGTNIKLIYPTDRYKAELINYLKIFLVDVDKYIDLVPIDAVPGVGAIDTQGFHVDGIQSFAYHFDLNDQLIYYSGDLGDINVTLEFLRSVEHENIFVFHEVVFIQRKEHVYYKEVEAMAEEFNVFAYHCNKANAPTDCRLRFVVDIPELVY